MFVLPISKRKKSHPIALAELEGHSKEKELYPSVGDRPYRCWLRSAPGCTVDPVRDTGIAPLGRSSTPKSLERQLLSNPRKQNLNSSAEPA